MLIIYSITQETYVHRFHAHERFTHIQTDKERDRQTYAYTKRIKEVKS
jgi:hypothetical protein